MFVFYRNIKENFEAFLKEIEIKLEKYRVPKRIFVRIKLEFSIL